VLFLSSPTSVNGVLDQILLLGKATGRNDEASALLRELVSRINAVKSKVAGVSQGPRVYHELDPLLFTVTPGDFVGDIYTALKAQNIAAGAAPALPQLSAEAVIQSNPQVVVLADEPPVITVESVKERPGWDQIDAVKNGRVHVVDPDVFNRPGPRIVDAMEALAKLLYPETFR
jgi:iron complex transport system substrate-binding protein